MPTSADQPSPSDSDVQLTAEIAGRVQGVGFRHFVKTHARRLGLTGWVRNEPEGTVTVVAEGPRAALKRLAAALEAGPPAAEVDVLEVRWAAAEARFDAFTVRR